MTSVHHLPASAECNDERDLFARALPRRMKSIRSHLREKERRELVLSFMARW